MPPYDEIAVDNTTNGRRGYIEVHAGTGVVELHAEDTGSEPVVVSMSLGEACALIAKLGEAVAAAL